MKISIYLLVIILVVAACQRKDTDSAALTTESIPHLQKQGTATQLIVNDKPFLMLGGELHNSSTTDTAYMSPIWKKMAAKNLNTVIVAVSWELIEKEEGKFDFSLVDNMIEGIRQNNLHAIIIWFASWKNGASTYMPSWVKTDSKKYPRVKDQTGKSLEVLSPLVAAGSEADARAFRALMKHIREIDEKHQTVIMMQVENELGVLNSNRDYSEVANSAYTGPIPQALGSYLSVNKDKLAPELYEVWKANGFKTSGTWEEVFGKSFFNDKDWKAYSYYTEELFMAYYYATYVERITKAGKEEYNIPMFVNAWLKQPGYEMPGKYPSGGPLPQVIDMWRAGAPSIDMIVPDIYMPYFTWVCEQYHRLGNPLLIPETRGGELGAARAFFAFAQFDAMCFSPFGIDSQTAPDALDESYATLAQLKDIILEHQGKGTMLGILVDTADSVQRIQLGGYAIEARLNGGENIDIAGGVIINTGPDEFIIAGKALEIFFTAVTPGDLPEVAFDFVDEGWFKDGKWVAGRRLNGDEVHTSTFSGTGLRFPPSGYNIQHIKLYRF